MTTEKKIGAGPYKGVRDFYPDDMAVQNYIFGVMRKTVENFGYEEYSASVLEPAELYRAKSGEEIVNEQMYVFKDRGEREVALRPEMTPSLARMVAARRRELAFPLRWYSIANVFRYERPQRGRLREHWQLNVDLFGIDSAVADAEIIAIAYQLLLALGLTKNQFEIRVNHCGIFTEVLTELGLPKERQPAVRRVLDQERKLPKNEFDNRMNAVVGDESLVKELLNRLGASDIEALEALGPVKKLRNALALFGISTNDVIYDRKLVRGFDYYTCMVFEVFDKNPANNRSLFGGGRYDNLLDIFGAKKIPAVGFGMGDVTVRDVLETYGKLPPYAPATDLYLAIADQKYHQEAATLADSLRKQGLNVAVDYSGRKFDAQTKTADKQKIPFVAYFGEEEARTDKLTIKNLATGTQSVIAVEEAKGIVKTKRANA